MTLHPGVLGSLSRLWLCNCRLFSPKGRPSVVCLARSLSSQSASSSSSAAAPASRTQETSRGNPRRVRGAVSGPGEFLLDEALDMTHGHDMGKPLLLPHKPTSLHEVLNKLCSKLKPLPARCFVHAHRLN